MVNLLKKNKKGMHLSHWDKMHPKGVEKIQSDERSSDTNERGEDLRSNNDQGTGSESNIKRRGRNKSENEFHDESPKINLETHLTQKGQDASRVGSS
jgi:hypothetical protein